MTCTERSVNAENGLHLDHIPTAEKTRSAWKGLRAALAPKDSAAGLESCVWAFGVGDVHKNILLNYITSLFIVKTFSLSSIHTILGFNKFSAFVIIISILVMPRGLSNVDPHFYKLSTILNEKEVLSLRLYT